MVAAARQIIAKPFAADVEAVNCHHNRLSSARATSGSEVLVTRKGAVSAKEANWGSFRVDGRPYQLSCAAWVTKNPSVPAATARRHEPQ